MKISISSKYFDFKNFNFFQIFWILKNAIFSNFENFNFFQIFWFWKWQFFPNFWKFEKFQFFYFKFFLNFENLIFSRFFEFWKICLLNFQNFQIFSSFFLKKFPTFSVLSPFSTVNILWLPLKFSPSNAQKTRKPFCIYLSLIIHSKAPKSLIHHQPPQL